jgi:orotate phosphoribosyltransferase
MLPSSYLPDNEIARLSARMLIEVGAIGFNSNTPYKLASGLPSPTYVDCRKLISFPRIRSTLMDFLTIKIFREIGLEKINNVAGGETAGIPFAALVAERMGLPMTYVRKKAKGYGKNARIEGVIKPDQNILLVEDLATDGGSKISFVDAIRQTGAECNNTAVIFYYDIFPEAQDILEKNKIKLHYLCSWWDILEETKLQKTFSADTIKEVESFLHSPREWQNSRLQP